MEGCKCGIAQKGAQHEFLTVALMRMKQWFLAETSARLSAHLALGRQSHETLSLRSESNHGGGGACTLSIFNHLGQLRIQASHGGWNMRFGTLEEVSVGGGASMGDPAAENGGFPTSQSVEFTAPATTHLMAREPSASSELVAYV
eukprot:908865-Pelagomonas_calceolata.AAC.9